MNVYFRDDDVQVIEAGNEVVGFYIALLFLFSSMHAILLHVCERDAFYW